MTIKWLTAFIDLPAERFDAGSLFWTTVTGSTTSGFRGPAQEFATLLPADGDPYLRVQQLRAGRGGIHLALYTDRVAVLVRDAAGLGARTVREDARYTVMVLTIERRWYEHISTSRAEPRCARSPPATRRPARLCSTASGTGPR